MEAGTPEAAGARREAWGGCRTRTQRRASNGHPPAMGLKSMRTSKEPLMLSTNPVEEMKGEFDVFWYIKFWNQRRTGSRSQRRGTSRD